MPQLFEWNVPDVIRHKGTECRQHNGRCSPSFFLTSFSMYYYKYLHSCTSCQTSCLWALIFYEWIFCKPFRLFSLYVRAGFYRENGCRLRGVVIQYKKSGLPAAGPQNAMIFLLRNYLWTRYTNIITTNCILQNVRWLDGWTGRYRYVYHCFGAT